MIELVFLVEEESAKALLEGLWPRLVSAAAPIRPRYIVFEGKQDLHRQLRGKIQGYLNPSARFIVLRDQDNAPECREVKRGQAQTCAAAGRPEATVRIACRELEAFYLGDLRAVEIGLGVNGLGDKQEKAKYRTPDHLGSPSGELEKLTRNKYQKVAGSRAIAPHLDLDHSRSRSFRHLVAAIRTAVERSVGGVDYAR